MSLRSHHAAKPYIDDVTLRPSVGGYADAFAARYYDAWLLVARILMGWIFLQSGWGKVTAVESFAASLANRGLPAATFWAYIGASVEFVGGVALILGLATRLAVFFLILFVIVATGISHRYWEYTEAAARRAQEGNFYKNLAMIGGLCAMFVAGAGRFSIDRLFHRSSR